MRNRRPRRKLCSFCVDKVEGIDYKDVPRARHIALLPYSTDW